MRESRFAKGGQPFAWGFGGCAPDHPSFLPAAAGGKNTFATALLFHQSYRSRLLGSLCCTLHSISGILRKN
jgi:hypothetical protein